MKRSGMRVRCAAAWTVVMLLIPGGLAAAYQGGASQRLAIVGGYLIDGTEADPIQNSVVLVEGERIVHVGTVADTQIPAGTRMIDANGYSVMPGLSDSHVHLLLIGHGIYDEYFPEYHYEQDRMREFMEISARQLLMAGVTSARDLAAETSEALWIRDQINAGRIEGPRLFVSGNFLQKTTPPSQAFVRTLIDGPETASAKTLELVNAGVDLIKVIQLDLLSREERLAIAAEARKGWTAHRGAREHRRRGPGRGRDGRPIHRARGRGVTPVEGSREHRAHVQERHLLQPHLGRQPDL